MTKKKTQNFKFVWTGRIENISGNRESVTYQHFFSFPQCFQMFPLLGVVKSPGIVL